MSTAHPVLRPQITAMLIEARSRTLDLVADLTADQMIGPMLRIVNPPLWEIGHVAWFQEKWALRHLRNRGPLRPGVDQLYDSAAIAHDARWDLPLPKLDETLDYMQSVLDCVTENLNTDVLTPEESYFLLLPLYHEAMHAEALAYTRQTHGYPAPKFRGAPARNAARSEPNAAQNSPQYDIAIPGGIYRIGATDRLPFVFDNEKWAHPVFVKDFRIARTVVTYVEFQQFVDDGGYREPQWWSREGWEWRGRVDASHPAYWRRDSNGRWLRRVFDLWEPLPDRHPVLHVNWFEAEAYCRWAGRRLPTEAEWEIAASTEPNPRAGSNARPLEDRRLFPWGDECPHHQPPANLDWHALGTTDVNAHTEGDSARGCRQMIGNVWEWTADSFQPYPGFVVDPYKEYSEPWFGDHKVLRGGCWATRSYLIRNTWRNFYTPDRRDVWAGFRTCALEDRDTGR